MLRGHRLETLLDAATGSGEPLALVAPATGETLGHVPGSTGADVAAAAAVARAAQRAWAARPAHERARLVGAVHDVVLRRRDELTDLVQLVTGKSRADAFLEVVGVLQVGRYHARRGARLLRPERRPGFAPVLSRARVRRTPVGVVGNITAWNYPLVFVLGDALPMLLAGNAVITKPDLRSVPLAGAVAGLLADAGLPDGLFQVIVGNDPQVGEAVVDHSDHVLFTGSERVGRLVAARAGERLVGCTLELGGKNATYVAADADVERAAAGAVRDCFGSAGQTCTSSERLYVHADIADAFRDALVDRVRRIRLGWTRDHTVDMGSLVSPEHLAEVLAHVDDATARGARVLHGGTARPDLGPTFMTPTVLADVPEGARCLTEETFGPVVVLQQVGSDEEALAAMNDTPTGLMASIWSRDVARAQRLAERVRTGTVVVNETHLLAWGSVAAPIGGLGTSGLGRRYGREGLAEFTRSQVVLTQHGQLVSWLLERPSGSRTRVLTGMVRLLGRSWSR
jgi:succinate-semialdehyde dehydrogenase / glutarate-semialdehyde dehydrogenase